MVTIGEATSGKAASTKKAKVKCEFNMNRSLGKQIEGKLLDTESKYFTPGQLFEKCSEFKDSGLTKAQFRGAVNRIRA